MGLFIQLLQTTTGALNKIYTLDEAKSIAKILMEEICKKRTLDLISTNYRLNEKEIEEYDEKLLLLIEGEPLQYVLGKWHFCGLPFVVNKNVLIPRPETEELVHLIIKKENSNGSLAFLEVGTGSGCIAISICKKRPNSNFTAIDISEKALDVAKHNAAINSCDINFVREDILHHKTLAKNKYDVIVSNPPYILQNEAKEMADNVLLYEPKEALFVTNNDPMQFYKAIIELSELTLNKNGRLYFETHFAYNTDVLNLLKDKGYTAVAFEDLSGKKRMVMATK
jgi:release factor glutamine methyltransferase